MEARQKTREIGTQVSLCQQDTIEINGRVLHADKFTAYVEFYLAHAFPVITVDNTALHPQTVANSFASMRNKIFDLGHLIKTYNPAEIEADHILGTIIEVEFPGKPDAVGRNADGSWGVQADRALAPGIRAVACMHKQAQWVNGILQKYLTGSLKWAVSMENDWSMTNSGFLLKPTGKSVGEWSSKEWTELGENTPKDLAALGWTYVPAAEAPTELLKCIDKQSKVSDYRGMTTIGLLGGLGGSVNFAGAALCPLGKEAEAEVNLMLAGKRMISVGGIVIPDVFSSLKALAAQVTEKTETP